MSLGDAWTSPPQNIPIAADADVPASMVVSAKHDFILMLTKHGFLFMFDIHSATTLFRTQVCQESVIATTPHTETNGIMCVTLTRGIVFTLSVNERNLAPFVRHRLNKPDLAFATEARVRVPTNDTSRRSHFRHLLDTGDIQGAAAMAITSPGGTLRTPDTIQILKAMTVEAGQPAPILQYCLTILETGHLDTHESIEFTRSVVNAKQPQLWLKRMGKFIDEKKLDPSEQLGDLVAQLDLNLALGIYMEACCHSKVFMTLTTIGLADEAQRYCAQVGHIAL